MDLLNWTMSLRTWDKARVVTLTSKTAPKMANDGLMYMFVGYAPNHADRVYRMLNPMTGRIHVSWDVV